MSRRRITRRWRWLSWLTAVVFVTARFDRWGCRILGHDLIPRLPFCWRCNQAWDSWEETP